MRAVTTAGCIGRCYYIRILVSLEMKIYRSDNIRNCDNVIPKPKATCVLKTQQAPAQSITLAPNRPDAESHNEWI